MKDRVDIEEQVLNSPQHLAVQPQQKSSANGKYVILGFFSVLLIGFFLVSSKTIRCMKGRPSNLGHQPRYTLNEIINQQISDQFVPNQFYSSDQTMQEQSLQSTSVSTETYNQDIQTQTNPHQMPQGMEITAELPFYVQGMIDIDLKAEQVEWISSLNSALAQEEKQRQELGLFSEDTKDKLIPITLKLLSGNKKLPYHFVEVKTFPVQQPLPHPPLLKIRNISQIQKNMPINQYKLFKLAKKLDENPNDPYYLELQYYFYDILENISQMEEEKPICVVSTGRNFIKNRLYQKLFVSVASQNYTNFKLVITDDASDDRSFFKLSKLIDNLPNLHGRTTLIKNYERRGKLASHDIMVRNFCSQGDIIVEIEPKDYLLGQQVFKLLNSRYTLSDNWFIYTKSISFEKQENEVKPGINKKISNIVPYRRSIKSWVTDNLRTYLQELYMRIPIDSLLEDGEHYYQQSADQFIIYPLTQLAGEKHRKFLKFFPYFTKQQKRLNYCNRKSKQFNKLKAQLQTPLEPLQSLLDSHEGKPKQKYKLSKRIVRRYKNIKAAYSKCLQRVDPKKFK